MTLTTRSEGETHEVAVAQARRLRGGDIVALYGELGAGKTQFVRGLCRGLNVTDHVASPTFVLLHRYRGRDASGNDVVIHHLDLYRVTSAEEILDLGYEEIFFGRAITIVEWADRLGSLIPPRRTDVRLTYGTKDDERRISIVRVDGEETAT